MKKITILILMLILLSISVYASWLDEGNTGFQDVYVPYTGYALNYPNPFTNTTNQSYTKCSISGSSVNPLAFDINLDSFFEIITGSGSTITIYDRSCGVINTFSVGGTIVNGLAYDNVALTTEGDLIIPHTKGYYMYKYDLTTHTFGIEFNYTNSSITISNMGCGFLSGYCILIGTSNKTFLADLSAHTLQTTDLHTNFITTDNRRAAISQYRQNPTDYAPLYFLLPICSATGSKRIYCDLYSEAGIKQTTYDLTGSLTSSGMDVVDEINSFIGKIGSNILIFTKGKEHYTTTNPDNYYNQNSINSAGTGALLFSNFKDDTANNETLGSNWAVGDINKDGINEACYLHAEEINTGAPYTYNYTYFTCLDGGMNTIIDIETNATMRNINNIVIADFDPTNQYMCIGEYEGIFCYNITANTFTKFISSGYSGKSNGYPIVYIDGPAGSPILTFTDDNIGFNIKSNLIGSTCGTQTPPVCDPYENAFSCPADCNINATQNTNLQVGAYVGTNSSNCASGYQELGVCALRPGGYACSFNNECLSGTCVNSKCNKPSTWQLIDASKTSLAGNDINSNNLISLITSLILALVIAIGLYTISHAGIVAAVSGAATFMGMITFFTIVGWLSPFILITMVLICALIITLSVVMGRR